MSAENKEQFVDAELAQVKQKTPEIEGVTLVAAVPEIVRATIYLTEIKQLVICMQFPAKYPQEALVTELKSKTLSERLLDGVMKLCDAEAKKWSGQKQVLQMIKFVKTFLEENPLCVCSEEISVIKKDLLTPEDEIKLKQKTSQIVLKIKKDAYFMNFKVTVPDDYPKRQVQLEVADQNFPDLLKVNFIGNAIEIARRCVQPPLKKKPKDPPFEPKPSVLPVCKHLIECVKRYPTETCPICSEKALLADPLAVQSDKSKRVERVYCGHLFHFGCLDKYLKTPPFAGGKKCPSDGKQIFHDKWKVSPELAEARWAHKQARQRELDEVVDFLE